MFTFYSKREQNDGDGKKEIIKGEVGGGEEWTLSLEILLGKDSQALIPRETTQIKDSPGALLLGLSGLW